MTKHAIGSETFSLQLEIIRYDSDDFYPVDAELLLTVSNGSFCGHSPFTARVSELLAFGEQLHTLYSTLEGKVVLREPFGSEQFLSFAACERGYIRICGVLFSCDETGSNRFSFDTVVEQTYIGPFAASLQKALRERL